MSKLVESFKEWRKNFSDEEVDRYDRFIDWVCHHGQGIATREEYSYMASPMAGWSIAQRFPHLFTYWATMDALGITPVSVDKYLKEYKEQEDGIPK